MKFFTTRIELHGAGKSDYDLLHTEMIRRGFSRTVLDRNFGVKYHLPEAEYDFQGSVSCEEVLGMAEAAARSVKEDHSLLVTEANRRLWWNLKPV